MIDLFKHVLNLPQNLIDRGQIFIRFSRQLLQRLFFHIVKFLHCRNLDRLKGFPVTLQVIRNRLKLIDYIIFQNLLPNRCLGKRFFRKLIILRCGSQPLVWIFICTGKII